jgi:hypothetical protein
MEHAGDDVGTCITSSLFQHHATKGIAAGHTTTEQSKAKGAQSSRVSKNKLARLSPICAAGSEDCGCRYVAPNRG